MAQVLADNVTIVQGRSDSKVDDGRIQTKQRVWTDTIETAALAAGTIVIADLPVGAKVQSVEVLHDDLGAITLSGGDSTDAARYFAAVSANDVVAIRSGLVDGFNYVIGTNTGDNLILLTNSGAATGTIKTAVKYTLS